MLSNETQNEPTEELKGEPTNAENGQEEKNVSTETKTEEVNEVVNEGDPKKEEKSAVQKRIDALTYERRKAESERDRLLSIIEKSVPQKTQAPPPEPEKEPEKFENIEEYTDYLVNKKMKEKMTEFEHNAQKREVYNSAVSTVETFKTKVESFAERTPDFFDKVNDPTLPTSEAIVESLIMSDKGPEVAYWLANNPDELSKIVKLPPYKQILAVGRIEASLGGSTHVKTSKAPEPINATKGGISMSDGPSDKDDVNTWLQKERARLKKIGRIRY